MSSNQENVIAHLQAIDWIIIVGYMVVTLGYGLYHARTSLTNMDEYFVAGRKTPWWLLGTSLVATTFAADTPLAISALVVMGGIWGNWYWWNTAMAGMLAVFFTAKLWRRSGALTDAEFIELRYSGRPASFLRGFRALYLGLPLNCLTIGWVNLAMAKIILVVLALDPVHNLEIFGSVYAIDTKLVAVMFCLFLTVGYTCLSGITGVMITDFFQFILAMFGSVWLAVAAMREVGGVDGLFARLNTVYPAEKVSEMTSFFPEFTASLSGPMAAFLIYVLLQWWTVGQTDGGGYAAQRMLSAKNEKHAQMGYLWYHVAHYCIRPWPWILTGLCAAALFPYIPDAVTGAMPDPEHGYVKAMITLLPTGLLGLMIASLFAAYMSTVDTQMNWGAAYLTNDFYKRFVTKDASTRHYMKASVVATITIGVVGAIFTYMLDSIVGAWQLLAQIYAGVGTVYLLRWTWWRINAWSEISAMFASMVGSGLMAFFATKGFQDSVAFAGNGAGGITGFLAYLGTLTFPFTLLVLVPFSTAVWITVTLFTRPVSEAQLEKFYRKVRPIGPGWRHIAHRYPDAPPPERMAPQWLNYGLGITTIYTSLFGMGKLLLGGQVIGIMLLAVALVCGTILWKRLSAEPWEDKQVANSPMPDPE